MKLGVLASGTLGGNLLVQLLKTHEISFVMTDKLSTRIIEICTDNNIDVFAGNPRQGRCATFIAGREIDVLISINYIFIVDSDLIKLPRKAAFNIHGSLLPKYRGRTPHVWAIICNEKEAGITAHLIDEGCDTGDIIEQVIVPILDNDTGATILAKYNELYPRLIGSVLAKIEAGSVTARKQDHSQASYYGKRTPESGRIDWNWQKERVRNWVRAQAYPYPGAFSYLDNRKITIDELEFDNHGFSDEMPNGLILCADPVLVKTPNGVLRLRKIREKDISFEAGKIIQ